MWMTKASVANLNPDWRSEETCAFCALRNSDRVVLHNELVFALRDATPVSDHHMLVAPFRHAPTYFDLTPEELMAANDLLWRLRARKSAKQILR